MIDEMRSNYTIKTRLSESYRIEAVYISPDFEMDYDQLGVDLPNFRIHDKSFNKPFDSI